MMTIIDRSIWRIDSIAISFNFFCEYVDKSVDFSRSRHTIPLESSFNPHCRGTPELLK